ncbi:hypothetical protein C1645_873361 [Glomus cerebriforme]|uniref:Uncharacterized protein n=1 Tax=Glomus cerebriforme TaxID=658196 RepID=A0A397TC72_9GLOM|nr:hypothetical protein C1645_873361 [Glomus cerebriforme]
MENYQQKIDDLLRKARAQGAARAAGTRRPFITNIVVTPKKEETPKEELKSLKDIWRSLDTLDSKNSTRFRKTGKSFKGKKSKTKKLSSGNKNHREDWQPYRTNMENIPVQSFVGFRRNKTSSLLEKCKEDTPPQLDKKYITPTGSPGSDQSSDSSPLKNAKKPFITNYFQRMGIKTVCPPDTIRSPLETEYTMVSSAFSENFSFTPNENDDFLMTSAESTPDRHIMILSDDEEMMISSPEVMSVKEGKSPIFMTKNATTTHVRIPFSPKVTLDQISEQKPDNGITPPNRSVIDCFQKGKRQQRSTEFVTVDKLNDISPDTLRILAAVSNGEIGLKEFKLENPFI